ncbi:hypothetical protein HU750_03380 [Pseudomonas sp. SWRI50]|uniref:hypothetical protein n=1 Tax=Pseudomonas sp. SWRI50 TaxID=2745484 RepID=UPI001644563A|nr:hypothetical protein [Pseudomonas sp. SWRI50]MBC3484702.1 hypothetical protein [Pseudomonas sp. SWRI50]
MKLYLAPILAIALAGCSTPPTSQPKPAQQKTLYRYPMPTSVVQSAQAIAARDLKDPDAAKFRDAFYVTADPKGDARDRSKDSICIEVNGKNSYGAYTGFNWTVIAPGANTVIQGGSMAGVVNEICSSTVLGPISTTPKSVTE